MRFGPFTLDERRWRLFRDGEAVDLSPRLVELLAALVSRAGGLVSKDELLDRFWPDTHVTENTLTRAIADIRKAVGDDPKSPRVIQTMARRGYRFVGDVMPESQPAPSEPAIDPYRAMVHGRSVLETLEIERLPDAIASFEAAVGGAPGYAPAHVGLANAYLLRLERDRFDPGRARDDADAALAHARTGVDLDPTLGEAWATLGFVLASVGGDIEEARAAARRAVALEPSSWRHQYRLAVTAWGEERLRAVDRTLALNPAVATAYLLAAMVYLARGADELAERMAARGAELQSAQAHTSGGVLPASGLHWMHGLVLLARGRHLDAIGCFTREAEAGSPRLYSREYVFQALSARGLTCLLGNDLTRAGDDLRHALAIAPGHPRAVLGLHLCDRGLRRNTFEMAGIEQQLETLRTSGRAAESTLIGAAALAADARLDEAVGRLRRELAHTPASAFGWQLRADPMLAPLRSSPAFDELVAQVAARAA